MVCALVVRRLKPGAYEHFRELWQPQPWWPGLQRVWLTRSDDDPDVVATWALLDLDEPGLDAMRDSPRWVAGEAGRLERISQHEKELIISGFFRVVEDITPGSGAADG